MTFSYAASTCNPNACEGLAIPLEAQKIINDGYENVSIKNILNFKYLASTTSSEINKCSILFGIDGNKIEKIPVIGVHEQVCNISTLDNKIVSSYRDAGEWNDDTYQISKTGKWELIFRDSCIGCSQLKRTYFLDNKSADSILLSDGDDFTKRKELIGKVSVDKAILYRASDPPPYNNSGEIDH